MSDMIALQEEVKELKRKLNDAIRDGKINESNDNQGTIPTIPVLSIGSVVFPKTEIISPYGLYVNLPDNISCLLFSTSGHAENKKAIGYSSYNRFKEKLADKGTVLVGNPETGSYILFDKDGKIEIFGNDELNITINNDKDVNIKAKNVKIDAEKTDLGVGGNEIARKGDKIQVTNDPNPGDGVIVEGGINTSI